MKISIITATLNNIETIENCISSIVTQNYSDIQHIVIDGGSTDGSQALLEEYSKKYDNVIYNIRYDNVTPSNEHDA